MKKRAFFLSLLILSGISITAIKATTFQPMHSRTTITDVIKEKDTPVLIKELILRMKDELEIDEDRFPELIQEVEKYTKTCSDPAAVAVLHSMTAELYHTYYKQNRWTIDQRTQLKGYVPEDIREWTSNLFEEKIREEIERSLQPCLLLQSTPTRTFEALVTSGKDARSLRPTLFEFLAFRAIRMQPSNEIYKRIIAFQNKEPNMKAVVLTELEYYRYLFDHESDKMSLDRYLNALDEMYRNYATQDFAVEILIAKQVLFSGSTYRYSSGHLHSALEKEVRVCKEGIRRFPHNPRTAILRNRLATLEQPTLSVSNPNTVYPGNEVAFKIHYQNIDQINIRIFKSLKSPIETERNKNIYRSDERRGELKKEVNFSLNLSDTYTQHDTTLFISMEDLGLYECLITVPNKGIKTLSTFSVSRMAGIYRSTSKDVREVLVTDFKTGAPIPKATVTYYTDRRMRLKALGSVTTNQAGIAVLPSDKPITGFQVSKTNDRSGMISMAYFRAEDRFLQQEEMEVSLFTDRGIYRPGQTIFFKGLAYVKDTDQPQMIAKRTFKVRLQDANGKEVAQKEYTSNEFGSFHGEFTIPSFCLSGSFRLSTETSNTYVKVEEYKRPSFQAEFLPIKSAVAFNDSVSIVGKAETFSGIALPEGTIKWRIIRRPFWLRFYPQPNSETILDEGETKLDTKGRFSVTFCPQKEETHRLFSAYQAYEVLATVTDSKGETQEARYSFVVGESSLVLSSNLPKQADRNTIQAFIESHTVNGERTSVSGSYTIRELKDAEKVQRNDFQEGKEVASGRFTTDQAIDPAIFRALPSGRYRLAFTAKDEKGRACKNYTDFILYGNEDKRPPVFSHTWVLQEKTSCLPGEKAEIVFGTSDKNTYVLYEWFVDHKRIRSERFKLSNENRRFVIPFEEAYGNGLVATFTFVKEGELYVSQIPVKRTVPNRKLNICPMSFRDRLLPGQHESWRFRVTDADSLIVSAEALASLYDASLDKLLPFNWYFSPERQLHLQAPRFAIGAGFLRDYQYDQEKVNYLKAPMYEYDQLNWFELFSRKRHHFFPTSRNLMTGAVKSRAMGAMADDYVLEEEIVQSLKDSPVPEATEDANVPTFNRFQLRKDFSETAFFYPTLRTNEAGDFELDFKVPESNTTWKLQVLANTKDLRYGLFTQEIVTNKPLMIVPNLPRFVRQGDQVTISAQVINHAKETTAGRVSIELFDPKTEEPILCLSKALRMFELHPDSVATLSWSIPVPKGFDLMGIRLIAHSEKSSDGEQHIIPVLSNQLLITESKPFYLIQPGKKEIKMNGYGAGITPFRTTLELSSNPIWYAVQALPTIAEPTNESSLSWFAAYYSNTLATHIAQAHPRIQDVVAQWKAQGGNENTLYSNLTKNEELKQILLEETPWVLAAENETDQKRRLSLLFNLNRADQLRAIAVRQLLQQQNEDGGWSWLKGLPSNRAITLSVLEGMAQLVDLNAIQYGPQEKEMQIKALTYLDNSIAKEYSEIQNRKTATANILPTPEQIRYLYVRSDYRDIPELGKAREAIRFFTRIAEREWKNFSFHEKAEIALLMQRNGKKDVASTMLQWFKRTATKSDEQGLYWANNRGKNNFFTSPIETHCLLMKLFNELDPDIERNNRMKQWLLNQKRTQNWESEPATVHAIYALLLTGDDWLSQSNSCSMRWGNDCFHASEGEIATGYLKKTLSQQALDKDSDKRTVMIEKEGEAPAWGAVYEQYFQNITEVKAHKGVLNVEKRLFIETIEDDTRQMRPIQAEQPLQVGDKVVVRLTIRNDREMDYVYLKDVRAGCFESADPISRTASSDGIWYYRSPKDASENFYFNRLPKGTFVVEYPVYVVRSGEFASGISTIQCLYAPEFITHTAGDSIRVRK